MAFPNAITPIPAGQFGFIADLQYAYPDKIEVICAAHIITLQYVLTTFQCLIYKTKNQLKMRRLSKLQLVAGVVTYQHEGVASASAQIRLVQSWFKHPNMSMTVYSLDVVITNDFVILELIRPFKYSSYVESIRTFIARYLGNDEFSKLKLNKLKRDKTHCFIAGWVIDQEGSEIITTKIISLITDDECKRILCRHNMALCNKSLIERAICVVMDSKHEDACNIDSGSILMCDGSVLGLIAWKPTCYKHRFPIIFSSARIMMEFADSVTTLISNKFSPTLYLLMISALASNFGTLCLTLLCAL